MNDRLPGCTSHRVRRQSQTSRTTAGEKDKNVLEQAKRMNTRDQLSSQLITTRRLYPASMRSLA
jgi:hypothetical protein